LKLSIVIVNYKSAQLIDDCLTSAKGFDSFNDFEWIIVDNQSNDNSKEFLTSKYPEITWIEMGYNAGFSRANNAGIKIAKGEIVLLLNPDTIILNDAISKCIHQFANSTNIACGVQLLNKDLSNQFSGSNFMKGGINHLLPLPYWGSILKTISKLLSIKKPSIDIASDFEKVDWINGAFLMVKKDAIHKAGLMDEDFFLYAEEIEWCSRLYKQGSLMIYGNIHVIHLIGETITKAANSNDSTYLNLYDKKGLQLILSNHLRIRKQYGIFWFLFQLLNYTFAVPVYLILSLLENILKARNPLNDVKKALGLAKNVCIVWMYSILIILNKPYFYKVL
jgi:GT2 family glycosyltransferase